MASWYAQFGVMQEAKWVPVVTIPGCMTIMVQDQGRRFTIGRYVGPGLPTPMAILGPLDGGPYEACRIHSSALGTKGGPR